MKNEEAVVRRWYQYWPFLVAVFLALLNIDGVVIPSLHLRNFSIFGFSIVNLSYVIPELSLFQILVLTVAISTPSNVYWYWFWGWLGKFIFDFMKNQKAVQEGIVLGKEIESAIQPVIKKKGFIGWIKEYVANNFNWATDSNNKYLKRLRRGGYFTIFLMSASPEPGGRVVATIFSRTFDSKKGLTALILGDTFKNFYMVYGFWNIVLRLPSSYFKIAAAVVVVCFIANFAYQKIQKRPA